MRNWEVARIRYSGKRLRNARMNRKKGDNVKNSCGILHTDAKKERSKEKEIS